jgi:hypothetical protein
MVSRYIGITLLKKGRLLEAQVYIVVFIGLGGDNPVETFFVVDSQTINIYIIFPFRQAYMYLIVSIRVKNLLNYARSTKIISIKYYKHRIDFRQLVECILYGNGNSAGIFLGRDGIVSEAMAGSRKQKSQYGFSQGHRMLDRLAGFDRRLAFVKLQNHLQISKPGPH